MSTDKAVPSRAAGAGARAVTRVGRPVLVYDGDCGMCTRLAGFAVSRLRPRPPRRTFAVAAWQHLDLASFGLTAQQCDQAVQWVDERGDTVAAQDAVARALLASRPWWRPVGALLLVPGLHALAGWGYRWVARNRHRFPGGTPACSMPAHQRPGSPPPAGH